MNCPQAVDYLHRRNVRAYVTMNTLIFSDELPDAARMIAAIAAAGTDAVIVQDLGLVRLIRAVAPELPIHASTQMTLTEPRAWNTSASSASNGPLRPASFRWTTSARFVPLRSLPLEVFVHGALCVAYSGQCLTSEALGGRSANRGQCCAGLPFALRFDRRRTKLAISVKWRTC